MPRGEIDVFLQNGDFVARIFVETNFADAEDVGAFEERRYQMENVVGERDVFGFFGIDAKPRVMLQAEFGGAFRFVFGELAKIIIETIGAAAVEAGPKRRFAD